MKKLNLKIRWALGGAPVWARNGRCVASEQAEDRDIGYQYLYLYVSRKPFTGEIFAMFLPRLNKEYFALFAEEGGLSLSARGR